MVARRVPGSSLGHQKVIKRGIISCLNSPLASGPPSGHQNDPKKEPKWSQKWAKMEPKMEPTEHVHWKWTRRLCIIMNGTKHERGQSIWPEKRDKMIWYLSHIEQNWSQEWSQPWAQMMTTMMLITMMITMMTMMTTITAIITMMTMTIPLQQHNNRNTKTNIITYRAFRSRAGPGLHAPLGCIKSKEIEENHVENAW